MSHLTLCLQSLVHTRTSMVIINQYAREMDWKCIRLLGLIIATTTKKNCCGSIPELCNDLCKYAHALSRKWYDWISLDQIQISITELLSCRQPVCRVLFSALQAESSSLRVSNLSAHTLVTLINRWLTHCRPLNVGFRSMWAWDEKVMKNDRRRVRRR